MGQFLMIGLATKMEINKKDKDWGIAYSTQQILSDLKQGFDIELYNIEDSEEKVVLTIKEDLFTKHIKEFIEQQIILATGKDVDEKLLELLSSGDYKKMVETAQDKRFCGFQAIEGISGYGMNLHRMYIRHASIVFFIEGKAYMECYYTLFEYISNLIKKSTQNPLKGAVMPMLE